MLIIFLPYVLQATALKLDWLKAFVSFWLFLFFVCLWQLINLFRLDVIVLLFLRCILRFLMCREVRPLCKSMLKRHPVVPFIVPFVKQTWCLHSSSLCPKDIKMPFISFLLRLYFLINFCPLEGDVKAKKKKKRCLDAPSAMYLGWMSFRIMPTCPRALDQCCALTAKSKQPCLFQHMLTSQVGDSL